MMRVHMAVSPAITVQYFTLITMTGLRACKLISVQKIAEAERALTITLTSPVIPKGTPGIVTLVLNITVMLR